MPTTPHPANHPDRSERKEFTITTNSAEGHPETDQGAEPASPPHHDDPRCPCGALADRTGLCRKCRARATWDRRQANRERHERPSSRPPSPSRRTSRNSRRPHDGRPGH